MKVSGQSFLLAGVGVAVVGLLVWGLLPGPVEADVRDVERGSLVVTVDHEGKTRVKDRYIVSSPLTGRLVRIEMHPGDLVETRKSLLAVLEPTDPALLDARARAQAAARVEGARASKRQMAANLDRAKMSHTLAVKELSRARILRTTGSVGEQEFESHQFRVESATAEIRAAEFACQVADYELEQAQAALIHSRPRSPGEPEPVRFDVHAPVSGVVLRVFQESATVVQPGARLLEVGDPTDLECEIDILSTDAVKVKPGQRVLIEHWGGDRPLQGRVRVREPAAFTKVSALGVEEQRVNIIVDLTDPPSSRPTLGDGYRVEARIVTWEGADVLKVPAGALFRRGGEWFVFRVERGRASLVRVEVGHSNALETEVLAGLGEGDRVVIYPGDRVEDGVRIPPRRQDGRR